MNKEQEKILWAKRRLQEAISKYPPDKHVLVALAEFLIAASDAL